MSQTLTQTQTYRGRVPKPKAPCANPLFESWLSEWREEAAEKQSKMQFVYGRALSSLRKYPLPLANGRECLILEYFGPFLAKMIDRRMQQENIATNEDSQEEGGVGDIISPDAYTEKKKPKDKNSTIPSVISPQKVTSSKARNAKQYIPQCRSCAYAILVAIGLRERQPGYRGYMTKSKLMKDAQPHCDSSMARGDGSTGNYTAWNSMATMIKKELVAKEGNPSKFLLTIEGRELAKKLLQADFGLAPIEQYEDMEVEEMDSQHSSASSLTQSVRVVLQPGDFEVVLYVDTSETTGNSKQTEVLNELRKNGIPFEVQRLSVGDFTWVCRESKTSTSNKRLTISRSADLVVPYVVERKRSDDLSHSIKDGRFYEQKFRLRRCGLLPIYLHEVYGKGDWGLGDGALQKALANTQVIDGFLVQESNNIKDTCAYLTQITRHFQKIYGPKKITSCTKEEWISKEELRGNTNSGTCFLMLFSDFNDFSVKLKNWTVTEMFARHLMRLRGLSVEKGYAIVEKYPTVSHLIKAYEDSTTEKEAEQLLAGIYFGNNGKTIGKSISSIIYKLYTSKVLQ